jgi:hypothetical protein
MSTLGISESDLLSALSIVMAAIVGIIGWWLRDQNIHTRERLEYMDAERWGALAQLREQKAQLDEVMHRLNLLERHQRSGEVSDDSP